MGEPARDTLSPTKRRSQPATPPSSWAGEREPDCCPGGLKDWSEIVDAGDPFVIVTREYNYGYPAAIKNAIDYLHEEAKYKPIGFISYGGVPAGTRAVRRHPSVRLFRHSVICADGRQTAHVN